MQLRHYAWVIRHWLWLILLCTLICAGATYFISKKTAPTYEAFAIIQVNDVGNADNSGVFSNQAAAVSFAIEVTNNDVLQEVAKAVPGTSMSELKNAVSASPLNNTALIEVRADAPGAKQAADIANAVASVFIQQQVARALMVDQRTASKLSQELVIAKANVDRAQKELTTLVNGQAPQNQIAHQTDVLNNYQLNYNTLFTSYSQIQLQENLIGNSLTVVQSAVPPDTAKGPHTSLNTALGAAMALLLTLALVLLLDWLDTTIKTSEDVAQLALLEPLGSIPFRTRSKNGSLAAGYSPILTRQVPHINEHHEVIEDTDTAKVEPAAAEQTTHLINGYREATENVVTVKLPPKAMQARMLEMRPKQAETTVQEAVVHKKIPETPSTYDAAIEQAIVTISTSFKALGWGKRSVLVTGLRSGAGTSLVASRLAHALTQFGLRVMLIDANLSRPTQHETFNLPNTRGLTNSLDDVDMLRQPALSSTWLNQWVTSVPNLYLLPAGPQVKHIETIRLISQLQMLTERLLQQTSPSPSSKEMVSDEIDIIIFDAPALDKGAGTIALAPLADCAILVIEAGKERSESLHRVQATFQRLGSPIIGVVVNRQQAKHQTYFYANRLQQAPVAAETVHTSSESKYPLLQKRAFPSQKPAEVLALSPVSQKRGAALNDDTSPRSIPATSIFNTSDATLVHSDPSQMNGLRPDDNQGRQVR